MPTKDILAPDVYVNASVAPGEAPEHVVNRLLKTKGRTLATEWVLERVEQMLRALPSFREEAVDPQMKTIRGLVTLVEDDGDYEPGDWESALAAAVKAAEADRVITDHPDLLDKEDSAVEYISSEAWLIEQTTPPPPPGG